MDINNFDQWLDTLGAALDKAKSMGMPQKILEKSAANLGDFLAENINPDIPENRFLRDLWEVADKDEKEAIAGAMIKMVEKRKVH
ncbi:DUF3243 domain-containing protein [Neomoorella thermoacetica]|uniref:DUF3243 domain-containing protein n=3 Tax=Neomoorella thermoacetica TaxID=1525 RepID=A0A1D7XA06_NEOTH|nr:DUF3243 domain-containing protein [Moorella thermoacetica]MDN5326552.1 hypothetical protein [Moorella sp. (in: firmicutes)]AKX93774.1 hypothetical protein MOTHE_c09720 [Moorella thermoacetica]AKX96416.1 hypothetical protein MOTHA_c10610 [Moorella thermoacetica]AOQ23696.1 hypothetical protein Maut_01246 [Moorella thermoacetica]OIQ08792.1 hypothetical protein MOOR_14530 [Moorella thermoacetica]